MPEELAFDQIFGQGAAIDGHERRPGTMALGVNRRGYQLLAGAGLAADMHRVIVGRHIDDLLEDVEHLDVLAHDVGKTRQLVGLDPEGQDVGDVPETGHHADGGAVVVGHGRHGHFRPPGLAIAAIDGDGIFTVVRKHRVGLAEAALLSAERRTEGLVAIPAKDILAGESSDALGLGVEEEDPPLHVMGDDPFLQVVQDPFQVGPVGGNLIEGHGAGFLSVSWNAVGNPRLHSSAHAERCHGNTR